MTWSTHNMKLKLDGYFLGFFIIFLFFI